MNWATDAYAGWDPFRELRSLQREMNRLFDAGPGGAARMPSLNLWRSEDEAVVTAEVPGVDREKLEVTVQNNHLTIQGERPVDAPAEDVVCHRAERGHGRFARTVRLPFEVENDDVSAALERGVLTVRLPRAEATKPQRIAITA